MDGLDESVEDYINKIILLEPYFGWGWRGAQGLSDTPTPSPFHARLLYLWKFNGSLRGGVAKIEEVRHPLDGNWAVFGTHISGVFDFSTRLGRYQLSINSRAPSEHEKNDQIFVADPGVDTLAWGWSYVYNDSRS